MDGFHTQSVDQIFSTVQSSPSGLTRAEAEARLKKFGYNQLPTASPTSIFSVFARQFANPLIYVLLIVAVVSLLLGHVSDAGFILAILILNAVFGAYQEYNAEQSAIALRKMGTTKAIVEREGENYEIDSKEIVIGDLVHIESGMKVPADLRLLASQALQIDESLLTGESLAVLKEHDRLLPDETVLGDRSNMVFAGTLVTKGRGEGLVVATGISSELGQIADAVLSRPSTKTPLVIRMERFTKALAIVLCFITIAIGATLLIRGESLAEVLLLSVALGVAAIPEGLPIALTVALAVASKRMAKKGVIVRNLASVEALGSCTFIGTDKTGTLTVNELTAKLLALPLLDPIEITGTGLVPEGNFLLPANSPQSLQKRINELSQAVVLCNEGVLSKRDDEWIAHGDAVDVALLVMAHKASITTGKLFSEFHLVSEMPFESEHRFSATLHRSSHPSGQKVISVKGAVETVLPMCNTMSTQDGAKPLDVQNIENTAHKLAEAGYRVLAVATQTPKNMISEPLGIAHLHDLTFLGIVALIDPLRSEAKAAINESRSAGIKVAMITGDHPATALAIARELELATHIDQVVTGKTLKSARTPRELDELIRDGQVFARVEPHQKLDIVQSLIRLNHFVAITGDGANDAPALKAAHVGIAMGKSGTDVARETADLIITDDRFSSLVAGIEEGRVAYSNVRKVVYLLISTSAAEIILFLLTIIAGLPMPLTAVQLLWLNLVTDGIQVLALAFEPSEGHELKQSPRAPNEPIFNRLMLERVAISAIAMGVAAFFVYASIDQAQTDGVIAKNHLLLLMVLFENFMIVNARSETKSAFALNPLRNPFLLFATLGALLLHIAAMHSQALGPILGVSPLSFSEWAKYLIITPIVLVSIELHKLIRWRLHTRSR